MKLTSNTLLAKLFVMLLTLTVVAGISYTRLHSKTALQKTAAVTTKSVSSTRPAVPQLTDHSDAQLGQIITTWASQQSFTASVYVQELTGNLRTSSYRADTAVVPASTYKIYVAYAVLHGVEQGTFSLNTRLSDGNTLQTDLTSMIVNSNNDAARTIGFLVGWENINSLLETQGLTATNVDNYVGSATTPSGDKHTTANDMNLILQKLYAGTLLNSANTQLLLGLMQRQNYRQRIPAGIPSSVTVADKPGWLTIAEGDNQNVQNDAAIVYGPKSTYILVINTTGSQTGPLTNLSKEIYNYLQS